MYLIGRSGGLTRDIQYFHWLAPFAEIHLKKAIYFNKAICLKFILYLRLLFVSRPKKCVSDLLFIFQFSQYSLAFICCVMAYKWIQFFESFVKIVTGLGFKLMYAITVHVYGCWWTKFLINKKKNRRVATKNRIAFGYRFNSTKTI